MGVSGVTVSLAKVDPSLNRHLEKCEGKQEGCAKAHDSWPPTPHCTSWLKDQGIEISTASRDCNVQCRILYLLPFAYSISYWEACRNFLVGEGDIFCWQGFPREGFSMGREALGGWKFSWENFTLWEFSGILIENPFYFSYFLFVDSILHVVMLN